MICVSIPGISMLPAAVSSGAELLELRFDLIGMEPEEHVMGAVRLAEKDDPIG